MTADEARQAAGVGPEWSPVSSAETREIMQLCTAERRVFNGCTDAELCKRYGAENVRHVLGFGWLRRDPDLVATVKGERAQVWL